MSGTTNDGAAYGYTKVLGYRSLVATRAEGAEIVAGRLREGSSQEGNVEFAAEAIGRVRGAGATGPVTLRADFGILVL